MNRFRRWWARNFAHGVIESSSGETTKPGDDSQASKIGRLAVDADGLNALLEIHFGGIKGSRKRWRRERDELLAR
jgi:hypothetical protein